MKTQAEREEYIWQIKNIQHPTYADMEDSDFIFLKETYLDLIIHFLKKKDNKSVEFLQNSWHEIEKQYAETPCGLTALDKDFPID